MKRPYCCDESRDLYERYYDRQQKGKGDFPVYVGRHYQQGHGIGSMLSSLHRRILPTLKVVAPHVLMAGVDMIEDVTSGKKWKNAAIKSTPGVETHQNSGQTHANATLSTAANLLENMLEKRNRTNRSVPATSSSSSQKERSSETCQKGHIRLNHGFHSRGELRVC
jgi:hypothetical protein